MKTMPSERRRYRFRAWHKLDRELYPVVAVIRGGVIIQNKVEEKTNPRSEVILMQYSGLNDVAGHDIYEGDIVEIEGDQVHQRKSVLLEDGGFQLRSMAKDGDPAKVLSQELIASNHVRVVGNIYQPASPSQDSS